MDHTLSADRHRLRRKRTLGIGLAMIVALHVLGGCVFPPSGGARNEIEPIDSPNNDRTLVIEVNTSREDPITYLTLNFEIRDKASQAVLHRQQTTASSRMAWSFHWLDNATVQLVSSDIGTYCWQEQAGGAWIETHCP